MRVELSGAAAVRAGAVRGNQQCRGGEQREKRECEEGHGQHGVPERQREEHADHSRDDCACDWEGLALAGRDRQGHSRGRRHLSNGAGELGAEVGRVVVYHISVFLEMTFPSTLAVSYNHCNPPRITITLLSKQSQLPAFTPFPSIHIPMDSVFDSILNSRGEEERKREEAVPEEENSPKRTRVDEEWIVCGTA